MAVAHLSPSRAAGAFLATMLVSIFLSGCGPGTGNASSGAEASGAEERPTSHEVTETTTPRGTDGDDVLEGTGRDDVIRAGGGGDVVRGAGGGDELYGGEGRDELFGGPGDDLIDAQDPGSVGEAGRDEISCGPGRDEVLMDADDGEKPGDCEMVGVGAS